MKKINRAYYSFLKKINATQNPLAARIASMTLYITAFLGGVIIATAVLTFVGPVVYIILLALDLVGEVHSPIQFNSPAGLIAMFLMTLGGVMGCISMRRDFKKANEDLIS